MITSASVALEYLSEGRCEVKGLDAGALAGWSG
jgi:hypothetical protein